MFIFDRSWGNRLFFKLINYPAGYLVSSRKDGWDSDDCYPVIGQIHYLVQPYKLVTYMPALVAV